MRSFLYLASLLVLFHAPMAYGSEKHIEKTVQQIVKEIAKQTPLEGVSIFVGPLDFFEAETETAAPLSLVLHRQAAAALKRHKAVLLVPGSRAGDFAILQGAWRIQGRDLSISLRVIEDRPGEVVVKAVAEKTVPLRRIDSALLTPDLAAIGRVLARKLDRTMGASLPFQVEIHRMEIAGWPDSGDLGGYLTRWVGESLLQSVFIRPAARGQDNASILKGTAHIRNESVEVGVRVTHKAGGEQIAAATVSIPRNLIPEALFTPPELKEVSAPADILERGYIQVVADSAPGQDEAMAKMAARLMAQSRLLEIIDGMHLERAVTVRKGTVDADTIRMQLQGFAANASVVREEYKSSDGSARVCLRLYLDSKDETGGLVLRALAGK